MLRILLPILCCFSLSVLAATYQLPQEGSNIVGRTQYHKVTQGESLADIAKRYDVGFYHSWQQIRGWTRSFLLKTMC